MAANAESSDPAGVPDPAAVLADEGQAAPAVAAETEAVDFDADAIDLLLAQDPAALAPDMRFYLEQQQAGERVVTEEQLAKLTPEGKEILAAVLAKIHGAKGQAEQVKSELQQQAEKAEADRIAAAEERAEAFEWLKRPEVVEHRKALDERRAAQIPELDVPPEVQAWLDKQVSKRVAEQVQELYSTLDKTQAGRLAEAEATRQEALRRSYNEDWDQFFDQHKDEFVVADQVVPERRLVQTPDGKQAEQVVNVPKRTPLMEAVEARMVASGAHPVHKWRYNLDYRDAYRLALLDEAEKAEKGSAEASMAVARQRVIQPLAAGKPVVQAPQAADFSDMDAYNAALVKFMDAHPEWVRQQNQERFGR